MKAMIVLAVLVAVAAVDYCYNTQKSKAVTTEVQDTVENTMSAAKQVGNEAADAAVETYHSEHPL